MDKAKIEDLQDALSIERLVDRAHDHKLITSEEFITAKSKLKTISSGFINTLLA